VSPRDRAAADEQGGHRITCRLDELLAARGMTLTELSERVGVSVVNLSILKNDRARAIRFSTLTAICDALECAPGDVLGLAAAPARPSRSGRAG
jgi:putative transcriptional regulator